MANSFLLPMHYLQTKNVKIRSKFFNEKYLILMLLVISIMTIFIILMNLPSDMQRLVNRQKIQNVFLPEIPKGNILIPHIDHQHPAPPYYEMNKNLEKPKKTPPKEAEPLGDKLAKNNEYELKITQKRNKIKEMALFGWSNYEKFAWGENELKPLSRVGHSAGIFGSQATKLGATIVDGLDTMYLMGFEEEYQRGREWILNNLNINVDSEFSAFEINIRFIGGLLSIYTLTEDKAFLKKAEEIALSILPIFDSPTGLPYALVNPIKKTTKNYNWASSSCSILSELGSMSLEFNYLSDLTENKIFAEKVERVHQALEKAPKESGLYYNYINPLTGKWCMKDATVGALGDSFYEYLLKLWLYKNNQDKELLNTYMAAMAAVKNKLLDISSLNRFAYFGEFKSGYRLEKKMDHLGCFIGGLLGMTAKYVNTLSTSERDEYLDLAKNITNTCHESYIRTPTHLGPEAFHFERMDQEAVSVKDNEKYYILRPEVIESYFYMWRFTKDEKYREWAWDAAQAIDMHCRTETGFSGIKSVYDALSQKDDVQQSFFFAETLKYLFLIFSDDDVLPLEKYVLNTEAHPFKIRN